MRKVKSRDTSLEKRFRSALFKRGLRFRKRSALPGNPDVVFPKERIVVFIDSCFWHGCPQHLRMPKSNRDYWEKKIAKNRRRDEEVNAYYISSEWTALRLWEHDLKENFEKCVASTERMVRAFREGKTKKER
ncbi:MAG TPA: very short patch repair endonuclease [Desulfobacterales bacterium]|nr:very short patch repair endonuclease [Desulfobacterales bacterium]